MCRICRKYLNDPDPVFRAQLKADLDAWNAAEAREAAGLAPARRPAVVAPSRTIAMADPTTARNQSMPSPAADRETRRQANEAFARGLNGPPAPTVAMADSAAASTGDPFRDRTIAWARQMNASEARAAAPAPAAPRQFTFNPGPPPPPDLFLGNPDVVAAARAVLGPDLEARATASREAIAALHPGGGFEGRFAMERHRAREILAEVAAGRPVDLEAIEARVGELVIREWIGTRGGTLEALASAATFFLQARLNGIKQLDGTLEYHGMRLKGGESLAAFAVAVGPDVVARAEMVRKVTAANASLKALGPAVAARVAAAVDQAGGREAVALSVKEARMHTSEWPGPDYELAQLEARLKEAATKMDRFRSADPEAPEGPMAAAARADRDGLLPMVEDRRVAVERAAAARVDALVSEAVAGDVASFTELATLAAGTPEAFAPGFVAALRAIPLAAALEAGPLGFAYCL